MQTEHIFVSLTASEFKPTKFRSKNRCLGHPIFIFGDRSNTVLLLQISFVSRLLQLCRCDLSLLFPHRF